MKKENFTPIFIALTVISIAVYDVWVIFKYTNAESISSHILSMCEATPFVPMLLGFTFGHLTFPNKNSFIHKLSFKPFSYAFFLLVTPPCLYDVYKLYLDNADVIIPNYNLSAEIPFLVSYILGHYLWPMNPNKWSNRFKIK